MSLRKILGEGFDVVAGVIVSVSFIAIIAAMVATGGTADKSLNGVFDGSVGRMEAELELDGE